jgi:hypothetical protein
MADKALCGAAHDADGMAARPRSGMPRGTAFRPRKGMAARSAGGRPCGDAAPRIAADAFRRMAAARGCHNRTLEGVTVRLRMAWDVPAMLRAEKAARHIRIGRGFPPER